jgi:RNA polymerase sigma-70 factor (ECF subfamily)
MAEGEEQRLIQASQQGDAEAFNQLVRLYEGRIYNLCYRMLGSADAAADAAQDSFISAFRSLHRFRGGSFRSWLFRIATNTCYDVLRARKRRPTASLDAAMESAEGHFEPPDHGESPDDFALRRELSAAIQEGLNLLPEDQRAVVILCDIHGMPYNDIAQVIGANLGTVKSRLSRGRARLRDVLQAGELLPAQYRHQEQEKKPGDVDAPARSDAAGA